MFTVGRRNTTRPVGYYTIITMTAIALMPTLMKVKVNSTVADDFSVGPVYIIILVLTLFIILTLNVPIIIILTTRKCLGRPIRNIHILSLSISDMLVGVNVIPISVILKSIINGEAPSYNECWSRMCLYLTCLIASFFHVLFICIDRCCIIMIKNRTCSRKTRMRFLVTVICSWICAIMCIVVPFVILKNNKHIPYCSISTVFRPGDGITVLRIWSILISNGLLVVFGACIWMIKKIVYVRINSVQPVDEIQNWNACGQSRPTRKVTVINVKPMKIEENIAVCSSQGSTNSKKQQISRSQTSAIKTIMILAISTIVCIVPMNVMVFIEGWYDSSFFSINSRQVIIYIASLNSAINPIIYAFRIYEVRASLQAWKQKMSCCHIYCICHDTAGFNRA